MRALLRFLRWLWHAQPENDIMEHVVSRTDLRRATQDEVDSLLGVPSSDWLRARLVEPRKPRRGRRESKFMDEYHKQVSA